MAVTLREEGYCPLFLYEEVIGFLCGGGNFDKDVGLAVIILIFGWHQPMFVVVAKIAGESRRMPMCDLYDNQCK